MRRVEIETVSLSAGAGDRALWRAVITQAINDATIFCNPEATGADARNRLRTKRDAIQWLTTPNANFSHVCALADLEPTQVRRLAQAWLAKAEGDSAAREARHRKASAAARVGRANRASCSRQHTFNGRSLTLDEWSRETGLNVRTLRTRLAMGWPIERALSEPSAWPLKKRPGVVANFAGASRDRPGSVAQESA